MSETDDLEQYVRTGSGEAFARVVRGHVDLVYAVARRRVGDPGLAEDVTQAVFLLLSRKAGGVGGMARLPAWLFKATRYVCSNARRQAERRRRHEEKAAQMKSETEHEGESGRLFGDLSPVLDEAVASLSAGDRDAVLLRYYQRKSLREVGEALGMSEEAARKRVSRAVGRLREYFQRAGVTAPVAAIDAALIAGAVWEAPAGLAGSATVVGGKSASVAALTKGAGVAMAPVGVKLTAGVVAAALAVGAAGTGMYVVSSAVGGKGSQATTTRPVLMPARTGSGVASIRKGDVTVSLLGITTEAEPGRWWGVNGEAVEAPLPPQTWMVRAPKEQVYRFAVGLENVGPEAGVIFRTEPGLMSAAYFRRVAGNPSSQLREAQTGIDPGNAKALTFSVGVAMGEWEVLARARGVEGPVATSRPGDRKVTFRQVSRTGNRQVVAVTHPVSPSVSTRLVAVVDGRQIVGTTQVLRVDGETGVTEVAFETGRELAELRFERRGYTWFEFKDVAMKPVGGP